MGWIKAADFLWILAGGLGLIVAWRVLDASMRDLRSLRADGINGALQRDAEAAFWSDVCLAAIPGLIFLAGWIRPFCSLEVRAFVSATVVSMVCGLILTVAIRNLLLRMEQLDEVRARKHGRRRTREGDR